MRITLTNDFGGLHKKYELRFSFKTFEKIKVEWQFQLWCRNFRSTLRENRRGRSLSRVSLFWILWRRIPITGPLSRIDRRELFHQEHTNLTYWMCSKLAKKLGKGRTWHRPGVSILSALFVDKAFLNLIYLKQSGNAVFQILRVCYSFFLISSKVTFTSKLFIPFVIFMTES